MVHQIRPDLWVVVDNDHTTKYHMKWLPANGRITENVHGVTGWARFTEAVVDGIDGVGPLPNIQRVHLCFAVRCPSRWCNSRYDILAHKRPWLHVRQVDAPGTELPTAAVGSHAGRPSSGTASAAVLSTDLESSGQSDAEEASPVWTPTKLVNMCPCFHL